MQRQVPILALFCVACLASLALARYIPEQVHAAFTGKADELSIMWVSQAKSQYIVQYGTTSKVYNKSEPAEFKPYTSAVNYKVNMFEAILKNLPANTKIFYRVGNNKVGWTQEFSAVTMQTTPEYPWRFVSYGDMDIGAASRDTANYVDKQVRTDNKVRFIIHQGDIPYAWSEEKWDQWGQLIEPIAANMPYMVCPGNHESNYNFTSYKNRFSITAGVNSGSNTNLFYSFNYLNIHFVALSSEHPYIPSSIQYKWFEHDLQNTNRKQYPIVVVYAHKPMFSSNQNHGSDTEFRRYIAPLFNTYNVTLALFGHVHAYERSCVLQMDKCIPDVVSQDKKQVDLSKGGTVHIVSGTAGFELNPSWDPKPDWSVYRETSHGSLKITVLSERSLNVKYVKHSDESVHDDFVISV